MADNTQMFSFSFTPEAKKFSIAFEGWAKGIKDWRRAWKDVGRLFRNHERQHFDSEGTTTGGKFAPLMGRAYFRRDNKTYAEWKAENYPGLPIMQRDRVLYSALVEGGQGALFRRKKMSMEIGIKPGIRLRKIAEAHQDGRGNAYAGENKEPRPPVRYGTDASDGSTFAYALSQIMQAHIVLERRRAFKKEIEDTFGKAHAESASAASATIKKMIAGTWK